MRTAFLQVLSDDSVVFLPGPQNGKKAWESKSASEAVLQWHAVLAATSTSGDLGYTTGPWTFKKSPADKEPTDFGDFVSIWRWENGKWKLPFDLGSDHPRRPAGPSPELDLVENHAPQESPVTALPSMLAIDRSYASDRVRHFSSVAEDSIRVYPPQEFPVTGREAAAAAALARTPKPIAFGEPKGEVSQGGDLGFAWGEYTAAELGNYLRISRKFPRRDPRAAGRREARSDHSLGTATCWRRARTELLLDRNPADRPRRTFTRSITPDRPNFK